MGSNENSPNFIQNGSYVVILFLIKFAELVVVKMGKNLESLEKKNQNHIFEFDLSKK